MNSPNSKNNQIWIMCVVCIITFFANNHVIMPDIMESRNIVTAREMVYDGHWLVPTMNGELRLEKPPLPTWFAAIAEIISPDNMAVQRCFSGLAALLLIVYFWKFAKNILKIEPLVPSLILCTCYNIILMGRTASWDIYCHAFMLAGIYHFAIAYRQEQNYWTNMLLSGLFTGLSIMSKGPVSPYALFLPFIIAFFYVYRPSTKGRGKALIAMIALALVIGSLWYLFIYLVQPSALEYVIKKESGSWINREVRPWYYYWKFFLESGVWSLMLLTAIFLPLKDKIRRQSKPWLFSMGWMLCSLILLSLMPEKKSRYLLPLIIPAAYVIGCLILWWKESFQRVNHASLADKRLFRINIGIIAFLVAILPIASWIALVNAGYISILAWVLITLFCIALAYYMIVSTVKLNTMGLVWGVLILFLSAEALVMPGLKNIINNPDMKSIEQTKNMESLKNIPFYHIDSEELRIEIVYAAHRNIKPLDINDLETVKSKMPFLLLSHDKVENIFPSSFWAEVESEYVNLYDDNHRPKDSQFYNDKFIFHATLIKAKPQYHE